MSPALRAGGLRPAAPVDALLIALGYRTVSSQMTLGLAADHVIESAAPYETRCTAGVDGGSVVVTVDAQPGVPITVTKLISYQSSRAVPPKELVQRCGRTLDRIGRGGFDALAVAQRDQLDRFVLAMFLLGDEFSAEHKRPTSPAALKHFRRALLMDLADVAGNASDGVHIAAAGGVWQALVFGFGGVATSRVSCRSRPTCRPAGARWSSRCASGTASCG